MGNNGDPSKDIVIKDGTRNRSITVPARSQSTILATSAQSSLSSSSTTTPDKQESAQPQNSSSPSSLSNNLIAGACAGLASRMVTAPLDLIRIRRQLSPLTLYPSESIVQSWRNIYRNEGGIVALFRGNLAAIYLWMGYTSVQFTVYNFAKQQLTTQTNDERSISSALAVVDFFRGNATATAFVSGAVAGACATLSTYPFDVCRTTFAARGANSSQASTETHSSSKPPPVTKTATETTVKDVRPSRPAIPFHSLAEPDLHHHIPLRPVPTTATSSTTMKKVLDQAVGATSNSSSSAASTNRPPQTLLGFVQQLYQTKGWKGFYAGSGPAVLQIIPYMGLNFALYDILTTKPTTTSNDETGTNRKSVSLSAYAGSISGAVSKLCVYPIDTVKRRLQAQAFYDTHTNATGAADSLGKTRPNQQYTGMVDCFQRILREESVYSLYRGVVPSVLKSTIGSGLSFAVFRFTKNALEAGAV